MSMAGSNTLSLRNHKQLFRLAPYGILVFALFLTACGTRHPSSRGTAVDGMVDGTVYGVGGGDYRRDGPHANPPANLDAIPDAVPRIEPLARGPNRPYVVMGKRYVPDVSGRPYRARGIASWYGRQFHGRPTSNGEIYNMYAMTAAHPTLPIPSYARVTNPRNGRSVIVRINDRGPFIAGRIIDLSYVAAYKLGTLQHGTGEVIVERIMPEEIRRGVPAPDPVMLASTPAAPAPSEPPKDTDQLEALVARANTLAVATAPPSSAAPATSGSQDNAATSSVESEERVTSPAWVNMGSSGVQTQTPSTHSIEQAPESSGTYTTRDDDVIARFANVHAPLSAQYRATSSSAHRASPATNTPTLAALPSTPENPSAPTTATRLDNDLPMQAPPQPMAHLRSADRINASLTRAAPPAPPMESAGVRAASPPSETAAVATEAAHPAASFQASSPMSLASSAPVFLQLGAFGQFANAHALAERLRQQLVDAGTPSVVNRGDSLYRVQLGPFNDPEVAVTMVEAIYLQTGIRPHIVRPSNP